MPIAKTMANIVIVKRFMSVSPFCGCNQQVLDLF